MSPSVDTRENRELASELKFLVSSELAESIHTWARAFLPPDPHAGPGDGYLISSIYFDTPQFSVYGREGSYGRSKYRIRRYGQEPIAFVERKLKTGAMVTKRRTALPVGALDDLAAVEMMVAPGLAWFQKRILLRRLKPVCQITYNRTALVKMTAQGPVRLTLDANIRAFPVTSYNFASDAVAQPVLPKERVVEIKFCGEVPLLFKKMIAEFSLNPYKVSKYRTAAAAIGFVPTAVAQRAQGVS